MKTEPRDLLLEKLRQQQTELTTTQEAAAMVAPKVSDQVHVENSTAK